MLRLLLILLVVLACSNGEGSGGSPSGGPGTTSPVTAPTTTIGQAPATTSTSITTPATTTTATPPTEVALVVGDFGTGSRAQREVAAAMAEVAAARGAEWFVTTGDNFYTDDVAAIWEEPFGWVAARGMELVPAIGNHDVESATRRELVREHLGLEETWYTQQIGEVTFVVLDGNRFGEAEQQEFLTTTLPTLHDQPVVVVVHQPPFSCGHHGPTPYIRDRWVPLFEQHGVEVVLSGHDHTYQRHHRGEVVYVVTGGGGAGLYRMEQCPAGLEPPVVSDDGNHHFLVLTLGEEHMTVEAFTPELAVLDRFEVHFSE